MSVQKTDRVLNCYRIGDPDGAFPIYDAEGARLYPGRWNTHTSPVIYTSEHYSTALLGKAGARQSGDARQSALHRNHDPERRRLRDFPDRRASGLGFPKRNHLQGVRQDWYEEKRAALLIVPSMPARLERNILINPLHPDARGITYTMPEPVWWDERLYSKR